MEFAQKDQNVILFISTISNNRKTVKRLRRRLAKTVINARTFRAIFRKITTKELDIPKFINIYNYYMNEVDSTDQLRYYYNTQRVYIKSWKSLQHFLLNSTIVNSYLLYYYVSKQLKNQPRTQYTQRGFRVKLTYQLFKYSKRLSGRFYSIKTSLLSRVYFAATRNYKELKRIGNKVKRCVIYLNIGRKVKKIIQSRKSLMKLLVNTVKTLDSSQRKRPQQISRDLFEYTLCEIVIYNYIRC